MIICRHEHGHVGYGAQNTHVLNALMACAVIGRGNAAMGAGDLHIQFRVTDFLADHLAHPQGTEYRVGHYKRDFSAGRKTCRNTGCVLLRYAHIQILLGELFAELSCLTGFAYIYVHYIYIIVQFAQLYNLFTKAISGRFLYFAHILILHPLMLIF